MKKVAVYLTGLIQDRAHLLAHVKQTFDYIAKELNLEIDYYCHFWDTAQRYPYYLDDNLKLIMDVPVERSENVKTCVEIFNPVDYKVYSFMDYYHHFLKLINYDPADKESYRNSKYLSFLNSFDIDALTNVNIHKQFFIEQQHKGVYQAGQLFNHWWEIHSLWNAFVLEGSQGISTANCNKMILQSGKQYDVCFKSRYDVLFNYHENSFLSVFNDMLELTQSKQNHVLVESIWYKTPDVEIPEDDLDINHFYCIPDVWWSHNMSAVEMLTDTFLDNYLSSIIFKPTEWNSQHAYFYRAFKKSKLSVTPFKKYLHDVIIRRNVIIPDDYHNNTTLHFNHLHNQFLENSMSNESHQVYVNYSQTGKYYTASNFNFDVYNLK